MADNTRPTCDKCGKECEVEATVKPRREGGAPNRIFTFEYRCAVHQSKLEASWDETELPSHEKAVAGNHYPNVQQMPGKRRSAL